MILSLSHLPAAQRREHADARWALALGSLTDADLELARRHSRALRRRLARAEMARRERLGEIGGGGEKRA